MAKQYTGIDGALYLDGNKVAKVTAWSFQATAETLNTTTLGDFASTSVYGVQSFSGSASILYYENDSNQIEGAGLMSDVIRTSQTPTQPSHTLELRYDNGSKPRFVSFDCLLNQVSIAAQVGGIITAEVSFTVTGPLKTASLV